MSIRKKQYICGKYEIALNMGPPMADMEDESAPSWMKVSGLRSYQLQKKNREYINAMD